MQDDQQGSATDESCFANGLPNHFHCHHDRYHLPKPKIEPRATRPASTEHTSNRFAALEAGCDAADMLSARGHDEWADAMIGQTFDLRGNNRRKEDLYFEPTQRRGAPKIAPDSMLSSSTQPGGSVFEQLERSFVLGTMPAQERATIRMPLQPANEIESYVDKHALEVIGALPFSSKLADDELDVQEALELFEAAGIDVVTTNGVMRQMGLGIELVRQRIESVPPQVWAVTLEALAEQLLEASEVHAEGWQVKMDALGRLPAPANEQRKPGASSSQFDAERWTAETVETVRPGASSSLFDADRWIAETVDNDDFSAAFDRAQSKRSERAAGQGNVSEYSAALGRGQQARGPRSDKQQRIIDRISAATTVESERRKREKPYAWSPGAIQRQRTLGGTAFPSMGRDTAERRAAAEGRFVSSLFNIDNTRVAKVRADSASDLPTFRKKPLEELSISDVNVQDELRQADKEVTPDLVPGDEDEDGGFEEWLARALETARSVSAEDKQRRKTLHELMNDPRFQELDDTVNVFLDHASADRQRGRTQTGVRAFKAFCNDVLNIPHDRPLDPNTTSLAEKLDEEWLCMRFVCALVTERGIAPSSAAVYFSCVQGWHAREHGIKLCAGLKLERLPQMLKGMRRVIGDEPRKVRRGFSPDTLREAMDKRLDPKNPLHANMRAALALAFQGLLRSKEYCGADKPELVLRRGDVRELSESRAVVMMHPCKNMKHLGGKTCPLVVGAGGKYIDAVSELHNLLAIDPVAPGLEDATPLFRDPSTGQQLTYQQVHNCVKELMAAIGENPDEFDTHSARIGGATALFAGGANETVIRTMGRWSSDLHRLYVQACFEQCQEWTQRAGSTKVSDLAGQEFDEVYYY